MTAREEILSRVRTANREAPADPEIPRQYRTTTDDDLGTFLDRLAHYEARTHVVNRDDLDEAVRTILKGRTIVTPAGIPDRWVADTQTTTDDPPLDADALDATDGVVTTCAIAIAQTGTIVLNGGPGMGRRALTLVPDYHLCIVEQEQIVSCVPEAIERLQTDPTRPLTFISGPSATVDIEMVRVRGVHGPRELEVIVATKPNADPAP